MEDELYAIAILIDNLKSEDVQVRLKSMERLSLVAEKLGPERTRTELLPFLQESLDDEDEVLVVLADELGKFLPLVGGSEYASSLLPILETLAMTEEAIVKDRAVAALLPLIRAADESQIQTYVDLVQRMATSEWFMARCSAAGLVSTLYPKVDEATQADLRQIYVKLCTDQTPIIRRAAAAKLTDWKTPGKGDSNNILGMINVVDLESVKTDFVSAYSALAQDEQDSVRFLAVEVAVAVARRLESDTDKDTMLMGQMRDLIDDKAWRVRYMVATHFLQLQEVMSARAREEDLVPAYVSLLGDTEGEVRRAAAQHIPDFCLGLAEETRENVIVGQILPAVKDLLADSSQHVRAALASQVMDLSTVLGKDLTTEHLIPLFVQLLKDEFPDVRLNIISKLGAINQVVGVGPLAQALLPAIVELAEDRQWRVRLAIIEYIPLLAEQLGREFFNERLTNLCMTWLNDCVYAIREAATGNLKHLAETFGTPWAEEAILPKVFALATHPNYLYRMTTLFCINALAPVVGADLVQAKMVPSVCDMAQDPVPNVRFNVAKTLEQFLPLIGKEEESAQRVELVLNSLSQDMDKDVKFYAQRALLSVAS